MNYHIFFLFATFALIVASCDNYERTEAKEEIYVDRASLSMFTGETVQLTASPTTVTYSWASEDNTVATVSATGLVTVVGEGNTNIVVNNGNVHTKVPLTAIVKIPMTALNLSLGYVELTPGAVSAVMATRTPANANDGGIFIWRSNNIDVATVSSIGDIKGVSEGATDVTCTSGNFTKTVSVSVAYTRPFKGPHILSSAAPCVIPMVNFDLGGEGYGFHDNDAGNSGGVTYRADNGDNASGGVDIENASNPDIGWTANGEWLQYTVEVQTSGNYQVEVEEASPNSTGSFRIEVNGVDKTGTVMASNTGAWGNFAWDVVPALLNLSAGTHKIKYYFVVGAHNIRTIKFTYVP